MGRILALDQALRLSGYAIFEDEKLIEYGTFEIEASDSIATRLYSLYKELSKLHEKYHFEKLYFEDIQNQKNTETYKKLAFVQAVVLLWCVMNLNENSYKVLSPSHWRLVLKNANNGFGFGRARVEQKKKAQELVQKNLGASVSSDEADAICIGMAGIIEDKKNKSAF